MNRPSNYSLRYSPNSVNDIDYPNDYDAELENVILYCRVSGDENVRETDLDTQQERLTAFCQENNLNIVMTVKETYYATSPKLQRPCLREAIIYCQKHKRQRVRLLFLTWDRFSENPEFTQRYIRVIREELKLELNAIEYHGIVYNPEVASWQATNRA